MQNDCYMKPVLRDKSITRGDRGTATKGERGTAAASPSSSSFPFWRQISARSLLRMRVNCQETTPTDNQGRGPCVLKKGVVSKCDVITAD